MSFWNIIWFIIVSFAFVAYLMVLFNVVADLFSDRSTSGWAKALWMICLIFFPFLTAVVYLIVRGGAMAGRQAAAIEQRTARQEDYMRSVARPVSSTEEISRARQLFSDGTITQAEFDLLKAKALA